jgi:hypothetical protein
MTGQEIVDCALREGRHIPRWLAQAIDDAIAVGRGKERERCAKEVEITGTSWGRKDWNDAITACAKAIRALKVT